VTNRTTKDCIKFYLYLYYKI